MIGVELRDCLASRKQPGAPVIIGEAALASRYARALERLGEGARIAAPDAAARGLLSIAREAELTTSLA